MSEVALVAKSGRIPGSPISRRLRQNGQVPGVVYGASADPVAISCDARELRAIMSKQQLLGGVIDLELDGKRHQVIVKEIQRHPVRQEVLHVDFQLLG